MIARVITDAVPGLSTPDQFRDFDHAPQLGVLVGNGQRVAADAAGEIRIAD